MSGSRDQARPWRVRLRRLRDGRGSISVELVVLAPALALLLLLLGPAAGWSRSRAT